MRFLLDFLFSEASCFKLLLLFFFLLLFFLLLFFLLLFFFLLRFLTSLSGYGCLDGFLTGLSGYGCLDGFYRLWDGRTGPFEKGPSPSWNLGSTTLPGVKSHLTSLCGRHEEVPAMLVFWGTDLGHFGMKIFSVKV